MPARILPARPDLDHLRNEAKALCKAYRQKDADAVRRVAAVIGPQPTLKLTGAQRVLAREYGFTTWARLRAHVNAIRGTAEAVDTFLQAVMQRERQGAEAVLRARPDLASRSLHVAAMLGEAGIVRSLASEQPGLVRTRIGPPGADALLWLGYSPFHGESDARDDALFETARTLLELGADANTRDEQYGVSALYAVTGFNHAPRIVRLLLEAGANPTDGESLHHAAEQFHEEALALLHEYGADVNATGEWGNTPLYFLLRYHDVASAPKVRRGIEWLLEHGADPNVPCGTERETALHVAARRRQAIDVVEALIAQGADVHVRRGDGRTAWALATRAGADAVAALLVRHGAAEEPLSADDAFIAACARGDVGAATRLASPERLQALDAESRLLLPQAAADGRVETVRACLAAGFDPHTTDETGGTPLHLAAIHGHAEAVRLLLAHGADVERRDPEHRARPIGWAFFGADFVRDPAGDYPETAAALLDAGVRPAEHERVAHAGVRSVLERYGDSGG
jgi:ankyrin repeat protein